MQLGGTGYYASTKEYQEGAWVWSLSRWGAEIGRGVATSEKDARQQIWKLFQRAAENTADTARIRGKASATLKKWVPRRPYAVAATLEVLTLAGASKKRVMEEAESGEQAWAKKDSPKMRIPLPTHHMSKTAAEIAAIVYDCCLTLGYITVDQGEVKATKKLFAYGVRVIGHRFEDDVGGVNGE